MKKRTVSLDSELCLWLEEHAIECHLLNKHEEFRLDRYGKQVKVSVLFERVIINMREKLQE